MRPALWGLWLALPLLATARAAAPPAASAPAATASAPSTQPALKPFQPGIAIDWGAKAVHLDGRIVLREGPLELFACIGTQKAHESIVSIDASATHIFMALGLIGLTPGHPPRWNDAEKRYVPASGDLIDVAVEWQADGQPRSASASDWMLEVEYGRVPRARPWVFAGSLPLRDRRLTADHSGVAIALVDFGDALLSLYGPHSDQDSELWALANTDAIPERETPVRVVLTRAAPRRPEVRIDARGDLRLDGRYTSLPDAADALSEALVGAAAEPVAVHVAADALAADEHAVLDALARRGVPRDRLRVSREPARAPR